MITEDYCDFETSKLLKEKGFNTSEIDAYFPFVYYSDGKIDFYDDDKPSFICEAVTLQMAMKWLREEKHIFIRIIQSNIEYCSCEIYFDRVRCHQFWESFDSYEEACEAAIKYCLINLI